MLALGSMWAFCLGYKKETGFFWILQTDLVSLFFVDF